MFYSICHGNILPNLSFVEVSIDYNLRSQPQGVVPFPRTESWKMNSCYYATLLWNTIPEEVRNKSNSREFKVAYKKNLFILCIITPMQFIAQYFTNLP